MVSKVRSADFKGNAVSPRSLHSITLRSGLRYEGDDAGASSPGYLFSIDKLMHALPVLEETNSKLLVYESRCGGYYHAGIDNLIQWMDSSPLLLYSLAPMHKMNALELHPTLR
jgi:hypothetical protein